MKKILLFGVFLLTTYMLQAQTSSLFATGFNQPEGITFDASGNLFVTNYIGSTVSIVDAGGLVVAAYAGFASPRALAFDASGNLYVANASGHTVNKVDASGTIVATIKAADLPDDLAFDAAGELYVSNNEDNTISKFDVNGNIVATYTGFSLPIGLAFDISGNLYVANAAANTVSKVDTTGNIVATFSGFNHPIGLDFDASGNLYVANYAGKSISMIPAGSVDGAIATTFMSGLSFKPGFIAYHNRALYISDRDVNVFKITGGALDKTHRYVKLDAAGNNDGTSWANAYTDLQTAINAAVAGDSLFVERATYQPAINNSFIMKEGVKIFGGFLGTETAFNQRSTTRKATLQGNGSSVIRNNNNGLTVAAVLDGFIVNGGKATGGGAAYYGGGMYNYAASPTISNCVFSNDSAAVCGGGIYNSVANPVITQCAFLNNTAEQLGGGGIGNIFSNPVITNCTFSGNKAATYAYGGGIYNNSSNPVITNCFIWNNTSEQQSGGGMYNISSAPTLDNCIFSENHADGTINGTGGGGICNDQSSPIITKCTFTGNTTNTSGTVYYGGAIYNAGSDAAHHSDPVITGCTFTSNATTKGGAICSANYSVCTVYNCTFSGNTATNIGGAVYSSTNAGLVAANCLFSGNVAVTGAGAIQTTSGASSTIINATFSGNKAPAASYIVSGTTLTNCIIWGNSSPSLTGSPTVTYSDIEGGYTGTGNINSDPLFVSAQGAGSAPFIDGDYTLQSSSPAINSGIPDTAGLHVGNTDLAGTARIEGAAIDMGAYETIGAPLPVTINGFTGKLQNGIAKLQWQIGVETNFNHFELQKGVDGSVFSTVTTANAEGSNTDYTASVAQVEAKAYYRLKVVDNDGKFVYSSVVQLSQISKGNVSIYPNPARDYINVTVTGSGSIYIFNGSGILVKKQTLLTGFNKIDIRTLSAGIYFAKVNGMEARFIKR